MVGALRASSLPARADAEGGGGGDRRRLPPAAAPGSSRALPPPPAHAQCGGAPGPAGREAP